ncbi:OsmC family peroxiredoxin [Marinilabiliaceae bacterium JC017]|nr:OsmC family peroxiredoxin [Marinilabiliaceae bacterium JC017]
MTKSTMTLSVEMKETFKTEVNCSHQFVIDQPKAAGGNNEGPNPLEVYLSSLPACICAIGRIIAKQRRINLRSIDVKVEGDIDKDFLLGKTTEGRAGFTEIRTFVDIDADMTEEEKRAYLKEIEIRCPIADNTTNPTKIKPILIN